MTNGQLIAQNLLSAFQVAEENLPEIQAYIKAVVCQKYLKEFPDPFYQSCESLNGDFYSRAGEDVWYDLSGLVKHSTHDMDTYGVDWADIDLPTCVEIFQSETFQQWSNEYVA